MQRLSDIDLQAVFSAIPDGWIALKPNPKARELCVCIENRYSELCCFSEGGKGCLRIGRWCIQLAFTADKREPAVARNALCTDDDCCLAIQGAVYYCKIRLSAPG